MSKSKVKKEAVEIAEKPVEKKPQFFVAEKRYINCRRGIVRPGDEVFEKDFPGGLKSINAHVEIGGIVVK